MGFVCGKVRSAFLRVGISSFSSRCEKRYCGRLGGRGFGRFAFLFVDFFDLGGFRVERGFLIFFSRRFFEAGK